MLLSPSPHLQTIHVTLLQGTGIQIADSAVTPVTSVPGLSVPSAFCAVNTALSGASLRVHSGCCGSKPHVPGPHLQKQWNVIHGGVLESGLLEAGAFASLAKGEFPELLTPGASWGTSGAHVAGMSENCFPRRCYQTCSHRPPGTGLHPPQPRPAKALMNWVGVTLPQGYWDFQLPYSVKDGGGSLQNPLQGGHRGVA